MRPFFDHGSEQPEQESSPTMQDSWARAIRDPPDSPPQDTEGSIPGGLEVRR